jgi:hypothetical protein
MNKPTIILLLILTFFSCQKSIERIDIANELRGNTFNMTSIGKKDTLTIDFKDSTFTTFEYNDRNLFWRIATFDNKDFLVFDNRIMAIKKIDSENFDGLIISEKDYAIRLEKRKKKWDKKLIFGTWIEEKYFKTDPINIPPPSPPPNIEENDFEFPPYYIITKDSIYSSFYYYKSKSKIDISNSVEFVLLNLNSKYDDIETNWRIKLLNDSIMILDRTITYPHKYSYHSERERDLKLIKKH